MGDRPRAQPEPLALPPLRLVTRVGVADGAEPMAFYLEEGRRLREVIDGVLPEGWSWAGKRVLDFGCGSARVLRHFAGEAADAQFSGCDIDESSIEWATKHLSPPFRFFSNDQKPPLELDSDSLDLIWAMSVFTHISDTWAEWLVELHRLLAPGGRLLASFLGEGMWEALLGEPYREQEVGMVVSRKWQGPDARVFHSEWWLREHWGRGFEVEQVLRPPKLASGGPAITHSYIVLRKRELPLSTQELERIDAREGRELAGLQTSLRWANRDIESLAALTSRWNLKARLRRVGRALITRSQRAIK